MIEKDQSDIPFETVEILPSSAEVLQQALEAWQGIESESDRAEVLSAVIHQLPISQPALFQQVLDAAITIRNESNRTKVLSAIALQLSKNCTLLTESHTRLLRPLLEAITAIQYDFFGAEILGALAPALPEPLLQPVLEAAINFPYGAHRVSVFRAIAPRLLEVTPQLLSPLLDAAIDLKDEFFQAEALSAIIPQLPETQPQLIQRAFEVLNEINESDRAEALTEIVVHLPKSERTDILQRVWDVAEAIGSVSNRAYALRAIAPRLPKSQCAEALQHALDAAGDSLQSASGRVEAVSAISLHLSEPQRKEALQQALESAINIDIFQNESERVRLLSTVASRLSESQPQLLKQALDFAINTDIFQNESGRAEVLSAIAPRLPESQPQLLKQLLEAVDGFGVEANRVEFWNAIAPQLSELQSQLLKQTLDASSRFESEADRVRILTAIAPRLPKSQPQIVQQALTVAISLHSEAERAKALSAISLSLSEPERTDFLQQALNAATNLQSESERGKTLGAIAPRLIESQLEQCLDTAINLESEAIRAEALSEILPCLPKSQYALLQRALKATTILQSESSRAKALSALVPQLSDSKRLEKLEQSVEAIKAIKDEYLQATALTALAKQLFGFEANILRRILEIALLINNQENRTIALNGITTQAFREDSLVNLLTDKTITQRFKETDVALVLSIGLRFSKDNSIKILDVLGNYFPDALVLQLPNNQLSRALDLVESRLQDDSAKTRVLSMLAPRLSIGLSGKALSLIKTSIQDEEYRVDAVCNLAPHIREEQFPEAIALITQNITGLSKQADAFEGLIPNLLSDNLSAIDNLATILDFISQQRPDGESRVAYNRILATITMVLGSEQLMSASTSENQLSRKVSEMSEKVLNLICQYQRYEKDIISILCYLTPLLKLDQIEICLRFLEQFLSEIKALSEKEKEEFLQFLCNVESVISKHDHPVIETLQLSIERLSSELGEIRQLIVKTYRHNWLLEEDNREYLKRMLDDPQQAAGDTRDKLWMRVHIAKNSFADRQLYLDAFNAIRGCKELELQIEALQFLIPHLPDGLRLDAAEIIRTGVIDLSPDGAQSTGAEGFETKKEEKEEKEERAQALKAKALIKLACRFPDFRTEATDVARALQNQVDKITQLSSLAVEVPERLLDIVEILEDLKTDKEKEPTLDGKTAGMASANPRLSENVQQEINKRRSLALAPEQQKDILTSLSPHLPVHISREVKRNGEISPQLWDRAIKILARSYRDALRGGSLRNDEAQDQDLLNLQDEINALSDLLLMRDLEPPMTVGILGGWGGGKSYIMHLMQTHMTEVRSRKVDSKTAAWNRNPSNEKLSPFVGHVYQIKFDAWTFAKADLWASFMQTIFFELDRQLTLEKQLMNVLSEIKNPAKTQELESKIWSVLYKSSDVDREWFLKRVLKDEDLLRKLSGLPSNGELWNTIAITQQQDRERLKALKDQLEKSRVELNLKRAEIRQAIALEFEPILKIQNNKHFKRFDALIGTSFELLRRRIGPTLFKELSNQIHQDLYGITEAAKSGNTLETLTPESKGLWGNLYTVLEQIETKKGTLEALYNSEPSDQALAEVSHDSKNEALETQKETQQKEIDQLLQQAAEIRLDILNVASTVVEQQYGRIMASTLRQWIGRNWILLVLVIVLSAIPIGLLVLYEINPAQSLVGWTVRLGSLLAPILPSVVVLQNLLRSGAQWFDEARLALTEYETAVEQKNKQREERIETTVEQRVTQELKPLELKVSQLEQQVREQEALVPANQYSTLADFVTGRIEAGTYKNHLGLMHQVKQDLLDLSNKLLPPSQYDPSFQTKIEDLRKIFPRGPARVVVYIDDLDRCPPERVVQVLEAIQLLVKTPLFIAVLAIDERYITRALEKFYEGVLSRRGHPSGTDYLEKIIQLPYRVRPIMANSLETYLRSQVIIQNTDAGGFKFSEFSRQEFNMLLRCCEQVDLSPRTLKRLTNIYKLFKIVCRTRGTKLNPNVQKAIMALLSLSGRYPELMRGIFDNIEACFEEQRSREKADELKQSLHLDSCLSDVFTKYNLPSGDSYLKREWEKLQYDALHTNIVPPHLTLAALTHEIFNLIRSFSFVGDVGSNSEDYSVIDATKNHRASRKVRLRKTPPEENAQN